MSTYLRAPSNTRRSPSPGPYVPQPESLILPDGAIGGEAAELLEELVHPQAEPDYDADYRLRKEHHKNLPWWKTPSPYWVLSIISFTAIAMSSTIAPRIEIYTLLACSVHRPDIFHSTAIGLLKPTDIRSFYLLPLTLAFKTSSTTAFISQDSTQLACASDPVVQAAVAKLSAVYTTSNGLLSCLTAAWWGSLSDRRGRTSILGISVVGLLFTDANFIFTTLNFWRLPGGYWFLILGSIVEGLLGGISASVAATHAYVADTTTESARSRMLSLSLGLLFTGMAVGPSLGGLLIRATGKVLSVFYAATFIHFIYACLVWFVVPEPLLKSQMEQTRHKYDQDRRDAAQNSDNHPTLGLLIRVKRAFMFLSPLSVFLPEVVGLQRNQTSKMKKDWSLAIIAVVYGLSISIMGSYTYKFQYAFSVFGWNSESLGYLLTVVGAVRAIFLTLVLPGLIKFLKSRPQPSAPDAANASPETQPLLSTTSSTTSTPHSTAFDFGVARVSLFIECIAYTYMALLPTALAFSLSSVFTSLSAGFSPAIQSVALSLYRRRGGTESGKLFGALSVVQALCSQILGPTLYGIVYMKTVSTLPRTIFVVSMITIITSFVLLSFVRLPQPKQIRPSLTEQACGDEETRIGGE